MVAIWRSQTAVPEQLAQMPAPRQRTRGNSCITIVIIGKSRQMFNLVISFSTYGPESGLPSAGIEGSHLSIALLPKLAPEGREPFPAVPLGFTPYRHQCLDSGGGARRALHHRGHRHGFRQGGSALWPTLDHCRRRAGEEGVKAVLCRTPAPSGLGSPASRPELSRCPASPSPSRTASAPPVHLLSRLRRRLTVRAPIRVQRAEQVLDARRREGERARVQALAHRAA